MDFQEFSRIFKNFPKIKIIQGERSVLVRSGARGAGRAAAGAAGAPAPINTSGVMPVVSLRLSTSRRASDMIYSSLIVSELKSTKST